ncbi:phosphoribosylaminoimidazole-succinocarboxamide synthase [Ligilactobacillus murinus DSM 20452 = NBRC 14221]|uniref:Phosphoribosylaminoimidazole-succinocarboxamide synthase n=1 Tax=Ligilactobacillus murinus DSM 20452 = NBRC 14221 TaxID=1423772 RepID=A0A0R2AWM3_9LACO|nr:phosphoribosylaminoimidazolesuccinocarboxamide synthase [Ligilactobacillus murinus]KRM71857.1 phosphoribosylaminoimidazole-succinocarboxamide synthase [Ligilactobacillus murinus DSM 20452 = NBRC 14221]
MGEVIYTGKAKQMWSTDDPEVLRVVYMDQATALNGKKKDQIKGKGQINNEISTLVFEYLAEQGIKTHFIKKLSPTEELVHKVEIIPLEAVTRNVATGHFVTRFGVEDGLVFETPVEETYYKSDALDDPFINESQTLALGLATKAELTEIWDLSRKTNQLLTALFAKADLTLVDFKLEFGRLSDGTLVLADEFSPDNCRLWDKKTKAHMDKDVYRQDLGELTPVYEEVLARLQQVLEEEK